MALNEFQYISSTHNLASQLHKTPKFFVNLKDSEGQNFQLTDPKAIRALIACMDMEASLKGAASHWGGPSAFAEILSALHALIFDLANKKNKNWFELFHLINDAGHCENAFYALKACYSMAGLTLKKLKAFRSLNSVLTGHAEAHAFPEAVFLSNGPLGSTLAQAQGLAMADKLIGNQRVCISTISDGACMEGEAKEALAAIPGFASKNKINPFILIVSDNNTKLSGRIDKDSFSQQGVFNSLSHMGWDCCTISLGNDLQSVFKALQQAITHSLSKSYQAPLALIFKTCKGFGVQQTVDQDSGGHGFPLKDPKDLAAFIQEIYKTDQVPTSIYNWCQELADSVKKNTTKTSVSSLKKIQHGISKALIAKKEAGLPLISISSDLQGSTGVGPFKKAFPQSSFDVGVAEANMISVAAGFSKQGFIPIVDTFAQFAVTKGILPLFMSALSQAPMIGIFSHVGFQDAADGASHQALSYFANSCSLPHTEVYALSCSDEAYALLSQALDEFYKTKQAGQVPKSKIFFLGRELFPESFGASSYLLNQAQVLLDASKKPSPVLIVSSGHLIQEALKAGFELDKNGQGVVVIHSPCVSDPDIKTLSKWLSICNGKLICLEDHYIKSGMAALLVLKLQEQGCPISQLKVLAMKERFGKSAYTAKDLYQKFHLDKQAILQAYASF